VTCLLVAWPEKTESAESEELNPNDKITYVEDGELSKAIHLPTYEWIPKDSQPVGLLLAVHGLTLHGKRYEIVCKAFAAGGFYTCAFDMRGFGRCYSDEQQKFWAAADSIRRVNYTKTSSDMVRLASGIKQRYPNLPLFLMGESLGTTLCIKLAAEHPELVDGLILSGPTAKVHPLMFVHPKVIAACTAGYFMHPRFQVNTDAFVKYLVSNDPDVIKEMLDDPLCRKGLSVSELLKTDKLVSKTLSYARRIKLNEPVLILQGSEDRCMVPRAVTELAKDIPSSDQTLRWLHEHGHLLLETAYLSPATVDALANWMQQHNASHIQINKKIQTEILQLGAKASGDK
jgi:alpha-beta hydrolase superfamily lysophospholipase